LLAQHSHSIGRNRQTFDLPLKTARNYVISTEGAFLRRNGETPVFVAMARVSRKYLNQSSNPLLTALVPPPQQRTTPGTIETTGRNPCTVLYFGQNTMGSHHPIRKTVVPEPVAIPDKLYFRIGDVAKLCDVPAYVLRFWETEFPQLKPNKGGTGQRLYRRKDVEMALRIKSLLYDQGYTIPGARQVFKADAGHTASSAEPVLLNPARSGSPEGLHLAEEAAPTRATPQLLALRDELRALASQLNAPVSALQTPVETIPRPRPSLVLEPRPKPAPKPLKLAPQLILEQRDLFGE
jgi:DNA-binding transcriptional MerR regulator